MFKVLALVAFLGQATAGQTSLRTRTSRHLSEIPIAGYPPGSDVSDHNALDLDQAAIENALDEGNFEVAENIYRRGAFSKTFATLTVPALRTSIGTGLKLEVIQDGSKITGQPLETAAVGDTIVKFQYSGSSCRVGGLPTNLQETGGCLSANGTLQVQGQNEISYSYNPLTGNLNGRTLAGFSTDAKAKMHDCGTNCPYTTYQKFTNYYGNFAYGDAFVTAAFGKSSTQGFTRGQMDFSNYNDEGREEIIKKASVFQNVWMYVIREMEDALDDCEKQCITCNDDSVHAWDEAVAFYTGSLEGKDGTGDGVMLHSLADKRCQNFKTCGEDRNEIAGSSNVNIEIFRRFKIGQNDLLQNNCPGARKVKEEIETLMAVPLIQGTLRYAWITDYQAASSTDKDDAEGAIFAASVLPLVHACSPDDAQFIYDEMRAGFGSPNFKEVKKAFERNYNCMGVTCDAVGGLHDGNSYLTNASPCGPSEGNKTAAVVGGILGGICAALILVIVAMHKCRGGGASGKDSSFVEGTVGTSDIQ